MLYYFYIFKNVYEIEDHSQKKLLLAEIRDTEKRIHNWIY